MLEKLSTRDSKIITEEELKSTRYSWQGRICDWSRWFKAVGLEAEELANYIHYRSFVLKKKDQFITVEGRNGIFPAHGGGKFDSS